LRLGPGTLTLHPALLHARLPLLNRAILDSFTLAHGTLLLLPCTFLHAIALSLLDRIPPIVATLANLLPPLLSAVLSRVALSIATILTHVTAAFTLILLGVAPIVTALFLFRIAPPLALVFTRVAAILAPLLARILAVVLALLASFLARLPAFVGALAAFGLGYNLALSGDLRFRLCAAVTSLAGVSAPMFGPGFAPRMIHDPRLAA
jgi:hypothetical protein